MAEQIGAKPSGVKRIIFKQIVYGDFRKFLANSNDAKSGGGARDLRFRPHSTFASVFGELFPESRTEERRRVGRQVLVEVRVGKFHWSDHGIIVSAEATFEPPTSAREEEGRIPTVHKYSPFNRIVSTWPEESWDVDKRALKQEGRLVLLLVQRDDGSVWPEFATESSLRSENWSESVANPIIKSLTGRRNASEVARGFIDFESGKAYLDGV